MQCKIWFYLNAIVNVFKVFYLLFYSIGLAHFLKFLWLVTYLLCFQSTVR